MVPSLSVTFKMNFLSKNMITPTCPSGIDSRQTHFHRWRPHLCHRYRGQRRPYRRWNWKWRQSGLKERLQLARNWYWSGNQSFEMRFYIQLSAYSKQNIFFQVELWTWFFFLTWSYHTTYFSEILVFYTRFVHENQELCS